MRKAIIAIILVLILAVGVALYYFLARNDNQQSAQNNTHQQQEPMFDKSQYSIDTPGSPWWIVNKERPLQGDYMPDDLVAPDIKLRWAPIAESMQVSGRVAPALQSMYAAMLANDLDIMLISGYRSEQTQQELYNGYVSSLGQAEADRISARPGTSEHQTGLAVDVGRSDNKCELQLCFAETPEGEWLDANAHEYGFIIRYPKGKESTVGYMYEPWHMRYVGADLAAELYRTQLTMEEFFGL